MDQRIESFLADVLALAGENPDANRPLSCVGSRHRTAAAARPRWRLARTRGDTTNSRIVRPKRGERIAVNASASARTNRVGTEAPAVHQPLRPPVSLARMRVASLASPATGTPIQVARLAAS